MKGSFSRSYLIQNQYSYCFRLRVPVDIQPIIMKKELRYSLKTGYLGAAKRKACLFAGLFWKLFDRIRSIKLKNMALPEKEFRELVENCMTYIEFHVNQLWDDLDTPRDATEWYGKLSAYMARTKLDLIAGDSETVKGFLESIGKTEPNLAQVDAGSKQWTELNRTLMLFYKEHLEHEREQIKTKYPELDLKELYNQVQDQPDSNNARVTEETPKTGALISEVIPLFISEEKIKWTPKQEGFVRAALDLLKNCIGDIPIQSVKRAKVAQYKEILKKLPPYKDTKQEYKGKSIDELVKMDIAKTLSAERVNKYLQQASALFDYAIRHGIYEGPNPATEMQLPNDKWQILKRASFTDIELERLFRSEEYINDTFNHPFQFWTPIIALFHGMRQNEIAGLFIDDIREEEGVWYFDLFSRKSEPDSARRVAPIHPFLISELHLIEFMTRLKNSGAVQLFPECTKTKDGYGKKVSRWFNEQYKIKCGIESPDNRKRDFHSFRATFITSLRRKKVHDRMLKEVVGHSVLIDSTDIYTDPTHVKQLLEEVVSKADFHNEIDLSHLKNSKWVVKP